MTESEDRWLELRRSGLGGSDMAAICGASQTKPIEVWRAKRGLSRLGDGPGDAAWWGQQLEPLVARKYAADSGMTLLSCPTVRHRERPWQIGTPDRLVYEPVRIELAVSVPDGRPPIGLDLEDMDDVPIAGAPLRHLVPLDEAIQNLLVIRPDRGLEIKTHNFRQASYYGEPGSDDVPQDKRIQAAWYCSLFEVDHWDIAVLGNTNQYRTYRIYRDADLEEILLEEGADFWQLVQSGIEPQPDGSEAFERHLNAKLGGAERIEQIATDYVEQQIETLRKLKRRIKQDTDTADQLEQVIKLTMGNVTDLIGRNGEPLLTWRRDSRGKVSHKRLAAHLADRAGLLAGELSALEDRFRGDPGRRFLVKGTPVAEERSS